MTALPLALGLLLTTAPSAAAEAFAEGASLYARRAEGSEGGVASPIPVEGAIAAYRRGRSLDPDSVEGAVGLMRALFFRGGFTDADPDTARRHFAEGRDVAADAVERVEKRVASSTGEARIAALEEIPGAASLYLWAGISWSQWALSTSRLKAARQGAASRIRDLAETSIAMDAGLEQGSAHVLLGRLHDQAPRIPFLTFWISRKTALSHLDAAHDLSPTNTVAQYFLAEAILDHAPERRAEAMRLLSDCAASTPRPEFHVEDVHYAELARRRLAELARE